MAQYWAISEENPYIDVRTNMFIPLGGVKGRNGFADVVIHNYGTMYIYEIKPQSHYEDSGKRIAGMVYYEFIEKGQEEQDEVFVMSKEEEEAYKKAQEAVGWSLLNNLGAIADMMIEEPEKDDIFSQIFSPKALIESILNGNAPMGIGGGIPCPVFM